MLVRNYMLRFIMKNFNSEAENTFDKTSKLFVSPKSITRNVVLIAQISHRRTNVGNDSCEDKLFIKNQLVIL